MTPMDTPNDPTAAAAATEAGNNSTLISALNRSNASQHVTLDVPPNVQTNDN